MSVERDRELAASISRELAISRQLRCACGVPADTKPAFHKRAACHDCVHHPRKSCGYCRSAERLIAGVEARLYVEAQHGPFIVTRWDAA